jgi:hypothetical protein
MNDRMFAKIDEGVTKIAGPEPRIRWLDDEGVAELPDPSWLVDGILPAGGLTLIYGATKSGKTFVALDMALCIASGTSWHGHPTEQRPTAYVMGEGQSWLKERIAAWKLTNQLDGRTGARFTVDPVSIMETRDVDEIAAGLEPIAPGAVMLDTLNRTMGRGNENAQEDMTAYVAGCDRIRRATGANVVVVHHTGWDDGRERGSSVLRSAADTVIEVSRIRDLVTVRSILQRNGPDFESIYLKLVPTLQSQSLLLSNGPVGLGAQSKSQNEARLLETVQLGVFKDGGSATALQETSGLAKSSFYHAANSLLDRGLLAKTGRGTRALYIATEKGSEPVESNVQG